MSQTTYVALRQERSEQAEVLGVFHRPSLAEERCEATARSRGEWPVEREPVSLYPEELQGPHVLICLQPQRGTVCGLYEVWCVPGEPTP